jgi:GH18 family chitinase
MKNIIISSLLFFGVFMTTGCQKSGSFEQNNNAAQKTKKRDPVAPEPTMPVPTSGKIVEGYYPSWVQTPVSVFASMKVDVINIALMRVQFINGVYEVNGYETSEANMMDLITRAHAAGKKVKFTIGGSPQSYWLSTQLTTIDKAEPIARAMANFCNKYSFDGVDLDLEDKMSVSTNWHLRVIELANQLRTKLPNKLISFTSATPASTNYPFKEIIKGIHPYVNTISLMCYDWYWSGDPSYVYNYDTDVKNFSAVGVPKEKIVLGFMPKFDDFGKETNLTDLTNACNYVKANNLAGVMYWEMNSDYINKTTLGVNAVSNTLWNNLKY